MTQFQPLFPSPNPFTPREYRIEDESPYTKFDCWYCGRPNLLIQALPGTGGPPKIIAIRPLGYKEKTPAELMMLLGRSISPPQVNVENKIEREE